MKKLIKSDRSIDWLPKPGECCLYMTDELAPSAQCATAFGFVFDGDRVLLTRLRDRDWDILSGVIEPGETPAAAAIREVWEETYAKVEIVDLIGIQEVECLGPKPAGYRWPYPISAQVYYLCKLVALTPFETNHESIERQFFKPPLPGMCPP